MNITDLHVRETPLDSCLEVQFWSKRPFLTLDVLQNHNLQSLRKQRDYGDWPLQQRTADAKRIWILHGLKNYTKFSTRLYRLNSLYYQASRKFSRHCCLTLVSDLEACPYRRINDHRVVISISAEVNRKRNRSTCSHPDVASPMSNPEAALRAFKDLSLEAMRTEVYEDVPKPT